MLHIRYFGSIRAAARKNQKSEENVEYIPGETVCDLMERLCGLHGEAFRGELFSGDELREDVTISLNGTILRHETANEIVLKNDDTLSLFPIFPGGG